MLLDMQGIVNKVEKTIEQDLAYLGLHRVGRTYMWSVRTLISGSLALNLIRQRSDKMLGVNPIIGVRSEEIEGILKKILPDSRQSAPTINVSLGYLLPEKRYIEWTFEPSVDSNYRSKVNEITEAVKTFGVSFVEANASLEALTDNLEHLRFSYKESARFRLPIAYFLLGKNNLAIDYIDEQLKNFMDRQDEAAIVYRKFAAKLLQVL